MKFSDKMLAELTNPDLWLTWAENAMHVLLVLALAWVFTKIARRLLLQLRNNALRVMERRGDGSAIEAEKRATTIVSALTKVVTLCIWLFALVMALAQINSKIEPLLAGLGVAGLAVGFGAQTLIKDWLGGIFLLLEDQARIGDGVTINGISGTVEEINLRTTVLRGESGAVYVIANGSITMLANSTRDYSYFVFETLLAHGADADRALAIVEATAAELQQEEPYKAMILAPIEVFGIDKLSDRGVTIKARIRTQPGKNGDVGHELNKRVRVKLIAEKIAFASLMPQIDADKKTGG
jgi:small-conductance mechanosensitive channel